LKNRMLEKIRGWLPDKKRVNLESAIKLQISPILKKACVHPPRRAAKVTEIL